MTEFGSLGNSAKGRRKPGNYLIFLVNSLEIQEAVTMRELMVLMGSIGVNILSSKGIALGLFLLLFYIKGRQLKFNSEEWDNYFLELSQETVIRIALAIAGVSITASALISYVILDRADFNHPLLIAAVLFCCSALWFRHKWKGEKGKAYLLRRFAEIPQTILEKRDREA